MVIGIDRRGSHASPDMFSRGGQRGALNRSVSVIGRREGVGLPVLDAPFGSLITAQAPSSRAMISLTKILVVNEIVVCRTLTTILWLLRMSASRELSKFEVIVGGIRQKIMVVSRV